MDQLGQRYNTPNGMYIVTILRTGTRHEALFSFLPEFVVVGISQPEKRKW